MGPKQGAGVQSVGFLTRGQALLFQQDKGRPRLGTIVAVAGTLFAIRRGVVVVAIRSPSGRCYIMNPLWVVGRWSAGDEY